MIIQEAHRISTIKSYYFAQKLKEIRKMDDIINLGIGSPDLSPSTEVIQALIDSTQLTDLHSYQPYRGIQDLREGFANWYSQHFGVRLDPNSEILPLIGSKEGIMHISMAFLNPGDKVLVPDPGYPAYRSTAIIAGADIIYYDLKEQNGYLPDLEALNQMDLSKVKIMWINYPHMPTGAKGDLSTLEKLVALAQRHKFLLCHDNPYSFILNDMPLSVFQIDGAKEVCIELSSLSKNYNMAGWRVACLAAENSILETILKFKSNMDSGMFKGLQIAATKALSLGREWFLSQDKIYNERRKLVWKLMDTLECTYNKNAAGLFVWAKIPKKYADGIALSDELLYNKKVFITPGVIFGKNGEQYIRTSLCQDVSLIQKAIERCK